MRPRVSPNEASLVLRCLLDLKTSKESKHKEYVDLNREVVSLRQQLHVDPYQVILKHRLPDKEKQLEAYKLNTDWKEEQLLHRLIKKYTRLSNVSLS
jgi:hypothetical protein